MEALPTDVATDHRAVSMIPQHRENQILFW
jgi:hypothetical protein